MLLVFLLLFSSVFTETKCLTPTELFNSLILDLSSSSVFSNDDQLGSTSSSDAPQNPPVVVELPLVKAQKLQQWVGQVAQQIVVEDGTFAGHYSCVAKDDMEKAFLPVELLQEQLNANALLLGEEFQKLGDERFNFLKMLFAFAALLSAEIGQQPSSSESNFTRIFLKAYECLTDKKFTGNEKNFLSFAIVSKMKGQIEQLNIEKVSLVMQNEEVANSGLTGRHLQIRKDLALLSALNIEMTAGDVIEFASFVHYALLNGATTRHLLNAFTKISTGYDNYLFGKMLFYTRNPFDKCFLAKNGLTIENIGQDPVKYRRIAYQLLIGLRNWDQTDLQKISKAKYYEIELTIREKCVFGIFTRNLMRRMANYELPREYFGEFNSAGLSGIVQIEQEFFEKLSEQNCNAKNERTNENEENGEERMEEEGRIYLHLDEAIQIEWNIWKEIIQKIDQISEKIKRKQEKQELGNYLESAEYGEWMRMIKAQFDEKQFNGLELKVEKKKVIGIKVEVMPNGKIIEEFCGKLAKMRQISEQNIEKYEREMPFKRNIVIKQKENYAKFYDFLILVAENFGEKIVKNENDEQKLQIDLNGVNSLLGKMYELAKIVKSGEELNFKKAIQKILNKKLDENLEKSLNQFEETKEFIKIPYKSAENRKEIEQKYPHKPLVEAQLFNLLFSFAVRLEAIVHGKKEDSTIEEEENAEKAGEKIQIFLAALGKFNLPEWANNFSIFDFWMKIKNLKQEKGRISVGIQIYRNLSRENDKALAASRDSFKMLKRINEHKFSVYETTKMLRKIYDAIDEFRYTSSELAIPEIAENLVDQIRWENDIKWHQNYYVYSYYVGTLLNGCEFVILFQNISKNFMKMMAKKGIDPQKHFDWLDNGIQTKVAKFDFPRLCERLKKIDRKAEETKIAMLNNVRYDLVVHFEFNRRKDIYESIGDLLLKWVKKYKLSLESTYFEENSETMIKNIYYFTDEENKEKIEKIEALKEGENDGFEIGKKFDNLAGLVRKIMDGIKKELEKAKDELEGLENEKSGKEIEKESIIIKLKDEKENMGKESKNENILKKEIEKLEKSRKKDSQLTKEFLDWVKEGKMTEKIEQIIKIWQIKKKIQNAKNQMEMDIDKLENELGQKGIMEKTKEKAKSLIKSVVKQKLEGKEKTEKEEKERKEMEKKKDELIKKQNLKKKCEKVYGKAEILWKKLNEIEQNWGKKFVGKNLKEKEEISAESEQEMVEQYEKEFSKISKELGDYLDDILIEFKTQKIEEKLKETETKKNRIEAEIRKLEEEIKQKMPEIEKYLAQKQRKIDEKKREVDPLESQFKEQTEELRKLAKSFGEMLEKLKKHYEEKKNEA